MEDIRKHFVALLADAIDSLKYGTKTPADNSCGGRSYRTSYGKTADVGVQLRRINNALDGARTLNLIPHITAKLSPAEISTLTKRIWAYRSIEAPEEIGKTVIEGLRERGVPIELLLEADSEAMKIAEQIKEGVWK